MFKIKNQCWDDDWSLTESSLGVGGTKAGSGFLVRRMNTITPISTKSITIQMIMPQGNEDDFPARIKKNIYKLYCLRLT